MLIHERRKDNTFLHKDTDLRKRREKKEDFFYNYAPITNKQHPIPQTIIQMMIRLWQKETTTKQRTRKKLLPKTSQHTKRAINNNKAK